MAPKLVTVADDPVRAKLSTEAVLFCPRRSCPVLAFRQGPDESPRCVCGAAGLRASVVIGLEERR